MKTTTPSLPLKLHLGCGSKYIEGFYHIDAQSYEHIDLVSNVEKLDSIKTSSVELIYACHILEHIGRHEYMMVLEEWLRVLKPGGVLRLAVPDFGTAARLYCEHKLEDGLPTIYGLVMGGQKDKYDIHKMIFDKETLTKDLFKLGVATVRTWDWEKTEHSHIDDYSQAYLPHMQKKTGVCVSLNLEAVK